MTQCALRPSDLKSGGGLANLLCQHSYPRVIRENHWSCCGSTQKWSTHCETATVDVTPKRSEFHRGEYRNKEITHQHWFVNAFSFPSLPVFISASFLLHVCLVMTYTIVCLCFLGVGLTVLKKCLNSTLNEVSTNFLSCHRCFCV